MSNLQLYNIINNIYLREKKDIQNVHVSVIELSLCVRYLSNVGKKTRLFDTILFIVRDL